MSTQSRVCFFFSVTAQKQNVVVCQKCAKARNHALIPREAGHAPLCGEQAPPHGFGRGIDGEPPHGFSCVHSLLEKLTAPTNNKQRLPVEILIAAAYTLRNAHDAGSLYAVSSEWKSALESVDTKLWECIAVSRFPRLKAIVSIAAGQQAGGPGAEGGSAGSGNPLCCYRSLYQKQLSLENLPVQRPLTVAPSGASLSDFALTVELCVPDSRVCSACTLINAKAHATQCSACRAELPALVMPQTCVVASSTERVQLNQNAELHYTPSSVKNWPPEILESFALRLLVSRGLKTVILTEERIMFGQDWDDDGDEIVLFFFPQPLDAGKCSDLSKLLQTNGDFIDTCAAIDPTFFFRDEEQHQDDHGDDCDCLMSTSGRCSIRWCFDSESGGEDMTEAQLLTFLTRFIEWEEA
jgi:hypothetical protein